MKNKTMKKNINFYKTSIVFIMILISLQIDVKAQDNTLESGIYSLNIYHDSHSLYLDANASQQKRDAGKVQLWNFVGGANQKWRITQLDNGLYTIRL